MPSRAAVIVWIEDLILNHFTSLLCCFLLFAQPSVALRVTAGGGHTHEPSG